MEELDSLLELKDPEDPFQQKRPPWLPHPELRETVPNVSLYSVLYKLPKKFVAMKPPADASDLDRQLTATVEFFDQCIPNQPGFSSSVVAATILPEAKHVALAWKEWYKCGKQLRKLRFIRSHIEERIRKQEEAEVIFVDADPPSVDQKSNFPAAKAHEENSIAADKTSEQKCESLKSTEEPTELQQYEVENSNKSVISSDETGKRKNKNENEIATKAIEQTTEKYSDKAANNNPTIYDDKSEVASAEFVAISKDRLAPVDGDCGFEPSENPFGALISGVKKVFYQQEEVTDESKVEVGDEVLDGQSHSETGLPKIAKSPGECSPERAVQFAEEDMLKVAENDTLLTKTKYRYDEFDMVKYAGVVGLYEEAGLEDLFSDFGIEQLSVYAREFAQGSSNACPFGCGEKAVKFASLKKLKMLEEKYVAAVNEANEELIEARATVSRLSSNVIGGESTNTGAVSAWKEEHANTKDEDAHDDNGKVDRIDLEAGTSKLNRESKSIRQRSKRASIQWEVANSIAQEIRDTPKRRKGAKLKRLVSVTSAQLLSPVRGSWNWLAETGKLAKDASRDAVIGVVEHSSYAVVTFTSRQAAIAARQCLADGGKSRSAAY